MLNKNELQKPKWKRNKAMKSTSFSQSVKSLEDFWLCLFIFVIQVVCISKACFNLNKYNSQSWSPNLKPAFDLWLYGMLILASIVLLPLFVITSLLKIGSYANDNFKFGRDLDDKLLIKKLTKKIVNFHLVEQKNLKLIKKTNTTAEISNTKPNIPPLSTSSFISSTDKSRLINSKYSSFISFVRALFSTKYFWKHLAPVSCLLHIVIAFFLLYPNLKFTSKEIEYGLRPKGYIHHSELDFLLERPLQRFSDSQSYFDSSLFSSYVLNIKTSKNLSYESYANIEEEGESVILNRNQIKLQLISSSLNDIDQINYEPRITLEFFNFSLALIIFAIRYASVLWHSNKFYSLIFSFHIILFACLSLISYSSFEILYKFQTCFHNGIKIRLDIQNISYNSNNKSNSTFQQVLFNLPFATNSHSLEFIFLSLMFLLLVSSMPIFSYGIYQYKLKFKRLQISFARLIKQQSQTHGIEVKTTESTTTSADQDQNTNNESCSSSSSSNTNQTNNIEYLSINKDSLEDDSNDSLLPAVKQTNNNNISIKKSTRSSANIMRSSSPSASSLSLDQSSMTIDVNLNHLNHLFTDLYTHDSKQSKFYSIYKPFKNHIFALVILLIICVYSALIVYDFIYLYQLTSDTLPFWSAVFHILFILWYILLWLILTFKTKWPFEFTLEFKLNYWNLATKIDQFNSMSTCTSATSSSTDSSNYSANECVEIILAKNKPNRSSYLIKTKPSNPVISSSCTTTTNLAEYSQLTLPNSKNRSFTNSMSQSMINDHKTSNTNITNSNKVTSSSTSSLANINTNSLKTNPKLSTNLLATVRNSTEVLMNNRNETSGINSSLSDYENFARNCSFNNNNMNKKQPSLRRLNQLMMNDSQRLAPVFENTIANKQLNNSGLNSQLMFLRRNITNSAYDDNKIDSNTNSASMYQNSILAVVNSQLDYSNNKNINSKSLNDSVNTNTNDETLSLIKKEEDSHLEYDLVTASIANRLSSQSNKSKASSLLNYATINELEKRASAIITNSSTKKNKNENRTSFKANNDIQLNELTTNLQKLSKQIESSDTSCYLTDSSPRSKQSLQQHQQQKISETSPKSNTSIISDVSANGTSNSSSSSSILNKQLNLNDNDSGRHSMSESPASNNPINLKEFNNTPNKHYFNKCINKPSAGTFSSKVTLSGTAVTLAQTMQSLEKHQQLINSEQVISKKKINCSRSRDSSLMTKSSSFCKVPIMPSSSSATKGIRSHSSNSRTASNCNINMNNNSSKINISNINGNINNNSNNIKSSSLSVNRNCSEL